MIHDTSYLNELQFAMHQGPVKICDLCIFSGYPLDHQSCKFLVGSYIHDNTQITFSGKNKILKPLVRFSFETSTKVPGTAKALSSGVL